MSGPPQPALLGSATGQAPPISRALAQLDRPPFLTFLAASAAFLDLIVARIGTRLLDETGPPELLAEVLRSAALPQNIGVIAGLVALVSAFVTFVGQPLTPSEQSTVTLAVFRRVSLAAFAIVFVFIVGAATVLPARHTVRAIVLLAIASGSVLSLLVVLHAITQPGPRSTRVGLALLASGSALSLVSLLLGEVLEQVGVDLRLPVDALFQIGQIAHLAAPLAIGFLLWIAPIMGPDRSRRSLVFGLIAAAITYTLLQAGYTGLPAEEFPNLLYAAQRIEVFLEEAPPLLFFLIALAFGSAVSGMVSRARGHRQLGAGLLLLAAAGYAPPTAARALWSLLGIVLIARSSLDSGTALVNLRRDDLPLHESDPDLV